MGKKITTLKDVPPRQGGIALVGINPAPKSVEIGHYYQGAVGQGVWARLRKVGALNDASYVWEDEAFQAQGNGLTDIVKRPTSNAAALPVDELVAGVKDLRRKLRRWKPGLILFAFRPPAEQLMGRAVRPGPGDAFEEVSTFLLTPPYVSRDEREANLVQLEAVLRKA
jgi:TDG/mug DNA glycosylase family protein